MAEVEDDEYALLRLHLTFSGDGALAFAYLPYAKAKLRELLQAGECDDYQVKSYTPETGVVVRIRLEGEERFVHIEAVTGCTDRPGFLLSRRGQAYDALYVDGRLENINPVDGSPRPNPDPAVRTKGYKVPEELRRLGLDRVSASRYSGLMRLAVACHHASGRNSPFHYGHTVTHGIVKKTLTIQNKTVDKYWVVEIRQEGVFVAPVNVTARCCDSWDVSRYMPRPKGPPDQPPPPKLTHLSLRTQFVNGDKRVQRILSNEDMAPVYGSGSPFYFGHGWAFSASGAQAQAVLQTFEDLPTRHYKCSRWRIDFEPVGENLGAMVTRLEDKRPATFKRNNVVWIPRSWGSWEGSYGAGFDGTLPFDKFPSQDAPVAVYYVGEEEQVLRWSFTSGTIPGIFKDKVRNPTYVVVLIETCPYGPNSAFGGKKYDLGSLTSGANVPARQGYTFGFRCPKFTYTGNESSGAAGYWDLTFDTIDDGPISSPSNTFIGLQPQCWYFNEQGQLVKSCGYTFEEQAHERTIWWWERFQGAETNGHICSVVLFAEEREAFMAVTLGLSSKSGTMTHGDDPGHHCKNVRRTKIDGGPCPIVELNLEETNEINCNKNVVYPLRWDETWNESTRKAVASLVLSDYLVDTELVIGPAPWYMYENYNLGTFLECNPTLKPYAESNVRAMHGNLHYPDEKLKPPDQRANRAYLLDNEPVVHGGFVDPADPVAFVGKS